MIIRTDRGNGMTCDKDENDIPVILKKYPDLDRYSRNRSVLRAAASVLWYAFWSGVYYAYFILPGKSLFRGAGTTGILVPLILAVILLFPFLVFKAHRLTVDKNYCGVVRQIRRAYKIKPLIPGASSAGNLKERECLVFFIEDSTGKMHEYTYWEKNEIDNLVYFRTGSRVIHFKEIKYPYNRDLKKEKVFCVICCNMLSENDENPGYPCPRCGHSIIRIH